MYGIFTYIYPNNHPNAGKYTSTMEHLGYVVYPHLLHPSEMVEIAIPGVPEELGIPLCWIKLQPFKILQTSTNDLSSYRSYRSKRTDASNDRISESTTRTLRLKPERMASNPWASRMFDVFEGMWRQIPLLLIIFSQIFGQSTSFPQCRSLFSPSVAGASFDVF